MKLLCILLATAAKLTAATLAHYDFNSFPIGANPGMPVEFPAQVVAAMPGTGSPAMLMIPGGGTGGPDLQYSQVSVARNIDPTGDLIGAPREFELTFDFQLSNIQMRQGPGIVRSAEEFSVFFDTPGAQRLDFGRMGSTGEILVDGISVGAFTFDALHHFRAEVDLNAATWSGWLDGIRFMDSRPMDHPQYLSVRLNLSDDLTLPGAPSAWVDNITLTRVPEPSAVGLLLLALLVCSRRPCGGSPVRR